MVLIYIQNTVTQKSFFFFFLAGLSVIVLELEY